MCAKKRGRGGKRENGGEGRGADKAALTFGGGREDGMGGDWRGAGRKTATLDPPIRGSSV